MDNLDNLLHLELLDNLLHLENLDFVDYVKHVSYEHLGYVERKLKGKLLRESLLLQVGGAL